MSACVSVIMPLYNNERYVSEAIESVLTQTYKDYEIIVVDDGSTDHGPEIVSSYPGIKLFKIEHSGVAKARNYALKQAKGSLISFIDSDDIWAPEKLEMQTGYLERNENCDIVFCNYSNFSDISPDELSERQKEIMAYTDNACLTAACMKRSLFEHFGLFNENYPYGEDTEWTTRLRLGNIALDHCINEVLYYRRVHDSNISLKHQKMGEKQYYSIMADAIRRKLKNNE